MINKEVIIHADKMLVWKAWTEADRITKWFAPEALIEPVDGGKFELYFDPSNKDSMNTSGCKILKIEESNSLVFQWKGPDPFAKTMNHENQLTVVSVMLESIGEKTKISLQHTGWLDSEEWGKAKEWHEIAWNQVLHSLKSNIESGEGILCCN